MIINPQYKNENEMNFIFKNETHGLHYDLYNRSAAAKKKVFLCVFVTKFLCEKKNFFDA